MSGFGSLGNFTVTHFEHFTGADGAAIPATWGLLAGTTTPTDIALWRNGMRETVPAVHAPYVYLLVPLVNTAQFKISADFSVAYGIVLPESPGVSTVQLASSGFGILGRVGLYSNNDLDSPQLRWWAMWGADGTLPNYPPGWDTNLWFRMGVEFNHGTITWYTETTPRTGPAANGPQNNPNMVPFMSLTGQTVPDVLYVGYGASNNATSDTAYNGVDELLVEEMLSDEGVCPSSFINPVWPMPA